MKKLLMLILFCSIFSCSKEVEPDTTFCFRCLYFELYNHDKLVHIGDKQCDGTEQKMKDREAELNYYTPYYVKCRQE